MNSIEIKIRNIFTKNNRDVYKYFEKDLAELDLDLKDKNIIIRTETEYGSHLNSYSFIKGKMVLDGPQMFLNDMTGYDEDPKLYKGHYISSYSFHKNGDKKRGGLDEKIYSNRTEYSIGRTGDDLLNVHYDLNQRILGDKVYPFVFDFIDDKEILVKIIDKIETNIVKEYYENSETINLDIKDEILSESENSISDSITYCNMDKIVVYYMKHYKEFNFFSDKGDDDKLSISKILFLNENSEIENCVSIILEAFEENDKTKITEKLKVSDMICSLLYEIDYPKKNRISHHILIKDENGDLTLVKIPNQPLCITKPLS
jgi:hypothetical protein